jgi:predicted DNA-binding transcriptional regulator AlpA
MDVRHLNQLQVARRWGISERTLERWRWLRQGPPFLKIGGHVAYRLSDIEAYEQRNVHAAGTLVAEHRKG